MPPRIFIRVDFPAPFSPTRARISAGITWRSTESRAVTPGNRLVIPFICKIGSGMAGFCVCLALVSVGLAAPPKLIDLFSERRYVVFVYDFCRYKYLLAVRNARLVSMQDLIYQADRLMSKFEGLLDDSS